MRTYGSLALDTTSGTWLLDCEPHVAMWAKRVFPRIRSGDRGQLKITHSNSVCRDLEWFVQRFPLDIRDLDTLTDSARRHQEKILRLDDIVGKGYRPRTFELAKPLRNYQSVAAELYLEQGFLLLGDEVGLGKTASAIGSLRDARTLPAVVVTLAHLPRQWQRELANFAPDLFTHVIKKGQPYELPTEFGRKPDVLIINYHKLSGWSKVLAAYVRSVIYDEVQELRRDGSDKYRAATIITDSAGFAIGLSATPIYNYGGEIFNVVNVLRPDLLGTRTEFATEWCEGGAIDKQRLRNPVAFGSYLREQHIMLRRTRSEVGRELPGLQRIVHEVDCDQAEFSKIDDAASELARVILSHNPTGRGVKMHAAGEFDALMRQATGLAKAPYVAAFVRLLVENGERVVLFGWHRAVYEIWLSKLAEFAPAMYTGSESPSKKQSEVARFTEGQTPILIMSLRSGAGVDGLQKHCRTAVIGELDWSPGVMEQDIGRIFRDGQRDPVTAYVLLASDGADPIMAETLGLKKEQIDGLRNPSSASDGGGLERLDRDEDGLRRLAERYLRKVVA